MKSQLHRELRVAFSRRAQPLWFRLTKWIVFIGVGALLWRTSLFWWVLIGALIGALLLHGVWRWKTRNWTQPWGGWNDTDSAGRP
jgi:hypothetical protein